MQGFEVLAEGLGFPEGPVVLPGGEIAFVDLRQGNIQAWSQAGLRVLAQTTGAPNGMRLGPDGALYICNNGGMAPDGRGALWFAEPPTPGRLQRLDPASGLLEDFATDLPGAAPHRPNDLVFTPEGEIVFTDPQNWERARAGSTDYHGGQMLVADADGRARYLRAMTGFPNGLAFHPDGGLVVGLTREHRLVKFAWQGGAELAAPEDWLRLGERFNPDGMIFGHDSLYVAGSVGDRIAEVGLDGQLIRMIDCGAGSGPTNLCLHEGRLVTTYGYGGKLVAVDLT